MASDIDDNIRDFGDLTSVELFTAIADNMNYLIDSCPVGEIAMIITGLHINQPALDATIWQECDGSAITETLSPLLGQNTPDLRDAYLMGTTNLGSVGVISGSHTRNLTHNHGGVTSEEGITPNAVDDSNSRLNHIAHTHPVPTDMTTPVNYEPAYYKLRHYIKIR